MAAISVIALFTAGVGRYVGGRSGDLLHHGADQSRSASGHARRTGGLAAEEVVPVNAPHPLAALVFIDLLLSPEGQKM
jgi:hypothetical protein